MVRPTVFLCNGKTCPREKGYDALRERLSAVADISEVRCQRICNGPVVGAANNGSLEWFERVRSDKVQGQLLDLVAGSGKLRKSLAKRRVEKRSGRLR